MIERAGAASGSGPAQMIASTLASIRRQGTLSLGLGEILG